MTKMVDRTGLRYGRLVVLKRDGSSRDGKARWLCKCDCGKTCSVSAGCLRRSTRSCGCLRAELVSQRRKHDLAGRRFGQLQVLLCCSKNDHGDYKWLCRCNCGEFKLITSAQLRYGTKSCGCLTRKASADRTLTDMTGKRYGRLIAISREPNKPGRPARWLFQCDCGNQVIAQGSTVRNGDTQSCGCLRAEKARERGRTIGPRNLKIEGVTAYEADPDYASRPSWLYLVRVNRWYLKFGIAFDVAVRGRGDYEEVPFREQMTRAQCWAVEQEALHLSKRYKTMTVPMGLKCKGFSEFRENMPEDFAIGILQHLCYLVRDVGWRSLADKVAEI